MERICLSQAVVVEGKYDKIKLESVVDALILTTDGFRIFKDRERRTLLRSLAHTRGLIVLTDSDAAGFRLRGFLSSIAAGGAVTHVFIPDIFGKEHRKRTPSAEGKLGVEGMDVQTLREALRRAGITERNEPSPGIAITRQDLYETGLMGGVNSAEKRYMLYDRLGLPRRISTSAALELLNHMLSRAEYFALVAELPTVPEAAAGPKSAE